MYTTAGCFPQITISPEGLVSLLAIFLSEFVFHAFQLKFGPLKIKKSEAGTVFLLSVKHPSARVRELRLWC